MIRVTASSGITLLVGLSLFAGAVTAGAQQPSQAQVGAVKQSCRTDYQSFCSGVPTGGSAALQCLQGHVASLSPACQTAVSAAAGGASARPPAQASQSPPAYRAPTSPPPAPMSPREEAALMRRSCGGDYRAYCQGVRPGEGRALACLSENQARLSPPCRGALAEARGAR